MNTRAGCSTRKPKKRRKPELAGVPKKKTQLSQRTKLLEDNGSSNNAEPLPKRCRAIMQEKVAMAFEPIVDSMIEKAKDGSYNHAQFLIRRLAFDKEGKADQELGLAPGAAGNLFDVLLNDLLSDVAKQADWADDSSREQAGPHLEPCKKTGFRLELAEDGSADA